jgi:hypothetical protein
MADVLTLHALDPALSKGLAAYARRERKSMNQSAKELLSSALGLSGRKPVTDHDADLAQLFGCIDDETWEKAKQTMADFEKVDAEAWK